MARRGLLRWVSSVVVVSLIFQSVGLPLATRRAVEVAIQQLEGSESLSREAAGVLDALYAVDQALVPTVQAAPPLHDPGDTDAESGSEDKSDRCKDGEDCGSQVQYDNRALTLSETLGAAGLPIIATYNSRYEMAPLPLTAWVPTPQPIDTWGIRIQGWTFEGRGSRPLAFWDTTDKQSGRPVPAGLYFYEVTYSNKLGTGSTQHPILVQRAADGPLGYNWAHNFQAQLVVAGDDNVILHTSGTSLLFTRTAKGKNTFTTSAAADGVLARQADGTWTWERTGADGAPVDGTVTFDAQGRVSSFADRLGNRTQLSYDADGRLTAVSDPVGRTTRLDYDGGHIARVTDAAGQVWSLSYHDGDLTEIVDPLGRRWAFAYDKAHRMTERRDPRGNITRYAYDAEGGITSVTDAVGNVVAFATAYDTAPMLVDDPSKAPPVLGTTTVTYRTPEGKETSRRWYAFDDFGRIVRREESPDGGKARYTWQYNYAWQGADRGQLASTVDPKGSVTEYRYLSQTALVSEIKAAGQPRLSFGYKAMPNAGWLLTRVTSGNDASLQIEYNERGLPTRVQQGSLGYWLLYSDPRPGLQGLPTALVWSWDGKGDPATAPGARMVRFERDALGQVTAMVDPLGQRTRYAYDAAGRIVRATDALGRSTRLEYDAVGRLVRQVDPAGGETRYAYDEGDNLIEVIDARGNRTRLAYDHKGRLIARTDPLGRTMRYGYDNEGHLIWREDARGARIKISYDTMGRPTRIVFPSGEEWSVAYDALGLVTRATTPDALWTFEHDAGGNLTRATVTRAGSTSTLAYAYDSDGRVRRLETSAGTYIVYGYGRHGELERIGSPLGSIELSYNTEGQIAPQLAQVRAGQLATAYSYDALGRLTELSYTHSRWSRAEAVTLRYAYDQAGNVASLQDAQGVTTYSYDVLDQLVGVRYPDGGQVSYAYDAVGNRTRMAGPSGVVEYTYDAANQLLQAGNTRFSYDANGHLISAWDGQRGRAYLWDYQGRLRGVSEWKSGALPYPLSLVGAERPIPLATYEYDLFGHRVAQDAGGQVTGYLVDREHVVEASDAAGTVTARAIHGAGWDELRATDRNDAASRLFPLADAMGTVTGAVDGQGQLRYAARYDPWGVPLDRPADSPLPGFQGRPYDPATGLYDFRARAYDPTLGRFLSPDPETDPYAPQTLNGYAFGFNNPLRYRDPTGRVIPLIVVAAIAGAAFGASYYSSRYLFSTPRDCWTLAGFGKHLLIGAAIGAIAGAAGASVSFLVGGGALGGAAAGAVAGFTQSIFRQSLLEQRQGIDWTDVAVSTVVGGVAGCMAGSLAAGMGIPPGTSSEAADIGRYGVSFVASKLFTGYLGLVGYAMTH